MNGGWILGLGGSKHDFAACLAHDGTVVVAIEEERLARKKRGYGVDLTKVRCIDYCLDNAGLRWGDLAGVCVNDLLEPEMYEQFEMPAQIFGHHLTHAASAYFPSSFPEAAVLVYDHSGGRSRDEHGRVWAETISYYHAAGNEIALLRQISGTEPGATAPLGQDLRGSYGIDRLKRPGASIGRFYARLAKLCSCVSRMGDGQDHTESGKLMGLAAHGDNSFLAELRRHVRFEPGGCVEIEMGGEGREGAEAAVLDFLSDGYPGGAFARRAAVARAAQTLLEEMVVHCATFLHEATGAANLCLAGGVALNGLANQRILERTGFRSIFVQPGSHDAGTALGAALLGCVDPAGRRYPPARFSAYLGRRYSGTEIRAAIRDRSLPYATPGVTPKVIAAAVAAGLVIGVFQGRSEFGPRALGNRSVLADGRDPATRDVLDHKIKFREPYRPYAPAVRLEDVSRYFEMSAESPHMLLIGRVRPEWAERLPAVTHVDGTARVQTVHPDDNPFFHQVLSEFAGLTGVGVVLNTSMNVQGEPIVESPDDALGFLATTGVDALVLEDVVCARTEEELAKVLEP
jgi:carbamoyltransferase